MKMMSHKNVSANHLASIFVFAYIMLGTVQTGWSQNQKKQSVGKEEHGCSKKKKKKRTPQLSTVSAFTCAQYSGQ